ncbi:MAG: zinc-dependent metalloprotease [Solirubrobacteraceae bacterium]
MAAVIDWIIAERIAWCVAGGGDAKPPSVDLSELAAESERRVVDYTKLAPALALPPPEGIGRREWIASNIASMRRLIDPVLGRAGKQLGPLRPMLQIGAGLVMSVEVGVVMGYLSQRVLGQYELVLIDDVAESSPPRLLFVLPNLGAAVANFGADEREFMTWVTLHEVTHAVQFGGVPWLHGYLSGLVGELLGSAEARIGTPRKTRLPDVAALKRFGAQVRQGDLFGIVLSDKERATIDRVQAVMAVIEGHAEHVMDAVAPDLLPSLPRLRETLDARRRQQSRLGRVIGRLLGLELKMRQYERGKVFCDAIVRAGGPAALTHVFSAPESLPTLAEIEDPHAWLVRTGLNRA